MTQSGGKYELQQLVCHLMVYSYDEGTGLLQNPVLDSIKSLYIIKIHINLTETNCMARALLVELALNKLLTLFNSNITENEINDINYIKKKNS